MSVIDALTDYATREVSPRPLAVLRIIVGLTALASAFDVLYLYERAFGPEGLPLPLFPLPRLAPGAILPVVGVWMACALCMVLGVLARPAAAGLAAIGAWTVLVDQQTYSNHTYLMTLLALFLSLSRCDASLRLLPPPDPPPTVPGWPARLIQLTISSVYLFGGLSKLNAEFLSGAVLDAATVSVLPWSAGWAWLTVLTEVGLAFALWHPRWRWGALVAGIGLHAGVVATMAPGRPHLALQLVTFACYTVGPYVLFLARRGAGRGGPAPDTGGLRPGARG